MAEEMEALRREVQGLEAGLRERDENIGRLGREAECARERAEAAALAAADKEEMRAGWLSVEGAVESLEERCRGLEEAMRAAERDAEEVSAGARAACWVECDRMVTEGWVTWQVGRRLQDARAGQEEAGRERRAAMRELEAARSEMWRMEAALEERKETGARLEEAARAAVERAEAGDGEKAGLKARVSALEAEAEGWWGEAQGRMGQMEEECGELERALGDAWGACEEVGA